MNYRIGIPTTGKIDHNVATWLTETNQNPIIEKTYSVSHGRNKITKRFLRETSQDWLIYLDDDTYPIDENVFEWIDSNANPDQVIIVPTLSNSLRWMFREEVRESRKGMPKLDEYELKQREEYELKPITLFGGAGICIHRKMLNKLEEPYWVDKSDITSEDFIFSKRLNDEGIQAFVLYGSALHHYKDGFDLITAFRKLQK